MMAQIKTLASLMIATTCGHALRLLYPQHPLYAKQADEPYQLEYVQCQERGLHCSLFDFDAFIEDGNSRFLPRPTIEPSETVLYRGWMMTPFKYKTFTEKVETMGGAPITSFADYTRCHHLAGWYEDCKDLTAETHFVEPGDDTDVVVDTARRLGWKDGFFVKDFVKSNTGDKGSIAPSPSDIPAILDQLMLYRGDVEGGIALRKVETFLQDSELRFFVVKQEAHGPNGVDLPCIVSDVAKRIDAPFFSVDVAQTDRGDWRLVELGDGQVSDKKEWSLNDFVAVLALFE